MKQSIRYKTHFGRLVFLLVMFCNICLLAGCSDDNKDEYITDTYLSILQEKRGNLEYLLENSTYGTAVGTYPSSSKTIMENAISGLDSYITQVKNGEIKDQASIESIVAKANQAIDSFKDSRQYNLSGEVRSYITQLKAKSAEYEVLLNNANLWGNHKGQYPTSSKGLLQNAVDDLLGLVENILSGSVTNFTETAFNEAIQSAAKTMAEVEATKWAEDHLEWNLYVDGNSGGYIDFGYSADYVNFGADANQSFTIELWVNIKEYCNQSGEDNSTFLSTMTQQGFWSGWRAQDRNKGKLLRSMVAYWNDQAHTTAGEWEPGATKSENFTQNRWTHYAFIFSDKGLLGNSNSKCYNMVNGSRTGDIVNIGETYRTYTYANCVNYQVPMTAFCSLNNDGSRKEYFSGYIKKIRIWKTNRSEDQIYNSYLGDDADVTATNTNLVAAWDFDVLGSQPTGTEFKDITGRHTATLKGPSGTCTWVESSTISNQ